jgi:hypothetical protein
MQILTPAIQMTGGVLGPFGHRQQHLVWLDHASLTLAFCFASRILACLMVLPAQLLLADATMRAFRVHKLR